MTEGQGLSSKEIGLIIKEPMNETGHLHHWVFENIRPWFKGKILELDSGSGKLAAVFAQEGIRLRLSDSNGHYCRLLQTKFEKVEAIKGIHRIKTEREDFERAYSSMFEKFDTILLLNIVEHERYTPLAIANAKKLLKENGHLVVLLRAITALYEESNLGYEEWRKENRKSIRKTLGPDLDILKTHFFQVTAGPGQYLSESKLESKELYQQKVAIFYVSDEVLFHKMGLSMIVLARKREKKNKYN